MVQVPGPFVSTPAPHPPIVPCRCSHTISLCPPLPQSGWNPSSIHNRTLVARQRDATHSPAAGTCVSCTHRGGWSGFLRTDPLVSLQKQFSKLHFARVSWISLGGWGRVSSLEGALGLGDSPSSLPAPAPFLPPPTSLSSRRTTQ